MIKEAIKNDNVITYFQPIINLQNNEIEKYETLVRIIDNERVVSPFEFLEISKKTSLYFDITKIVIQKTISTALKYPQYRFSINLSMSDILNDSLINELFNLFEKNIRVAHRIDIELLETENLNDIHKVKLFIERVHSYGSLVLIDDFGSGYSNFAYFSELDIDIVKIDGSIINKITHDDRKYHMLESIVRFCEGMDLKMVAEFVDNEEIVKILKDLGVNYAQGFYFYKPLKEPLS
jgi:EAL domain-containing protein (putative c-di-GMP-specific phosphodiesterase class I)